MKVRVLVDIDVEAKEAKGSTALHLAANFGHRGVAEVLLLGASRNRGESRRQPSPFRAADSVAVQRARPVHRCGVDRHPPPRSPFDGLPRG